MMDDTTSTEHKTHTKRRFKFNKNKAKSENEGGGEEGDDDTLGEQAEVDVEAWGTLSKSFRRVQTLLDKNRELIQQANENHQSKIPDDIAKNVGLIREINGNILKVISIYSDLSTDFSNIVNQRKRMKNNEGHTESLES
ncbi:protein ELF4-LIKE 1-like [Pistacia vera]|uniref:protein ELF4-LIKE 1-like n=1 Tax=Pistacia vera TaxID=55513 RepID=UPI0012634DDB|nr:protein ELF4-LIKE 1-like [Pistacia vera]XP_031271033.1 protein ELF4-LIKE 1-like [Pistacia vera]